MQLTLPSVVKGAATWLPYVSGLTNSSTGGTVSVRYCYSVWMRHLCSVSKTLGVTRPRCIAELGPGDSVGIGLAAVLSGADRYYGLDRVPFAKSETNLLMLDELITLFRNRCPIPGDVEFPGVFPKLESYEFPAILLDDVWLDHCLATTRIESIKRALEGSADTHSDVQIRYFAPWDDSAGILAESVDWVFSQAVLEHVDDVQATYTNLTKWLRSGGIMSHTIDYSCHGLTREWNGHWSVGDRMWRIARGRRPYFINRLPHSAHMQMIRACGCQIAAEIPVSAQTLDRATIAPPFRILDERDLSTMSAFVVVVKPAGRLLNVENDHFNACSINGNGLEGYAQQRLLPQMAINAFDTPEGTAEQFQHFKAMAGYTRESVFSLLDVGGGTGFFAAAVKKEFPNAAISILDLDEASVRKSKEVGLDAFQGSIIDPPSAIRGKTFDVVSFNLILHHIIADDGQSTYDLQYRALEQGYRLLTKEGKMFVHEICYEGRLIGDLSARLIYAFTSSRFLGTVSRIIGNVIPALKANTAGIGVRFRPSATWITLANKTGLILIDKCKGEPERHSWMRRVCLLIREVRRHSWLMSSAAKAL